MRSPNPQNSRETDPELAGVVERNIHALLARRTREERTRRPSERIADSIGTFVGSMAFIYIHLVLFGAWSIGNLPGVPFPKFDPGLAGLATFASVEAIFLSTFVLIQQNRAANLADKRNNLHLQISLLAEHEVTKLIRLMSEVAARVGIDAEKDPELRELMRHIGPEKVLDTLDEAAKEHEDESSGAGRIPPGNPA